MNDAAFYKDFYTWLLVLGAVVLVAAVLLILILIAAKRIQKLAVAALPIVVKIKENTLSIWELQNTNHKALDILGETKGIETNAGAVAQALHETEKQS